MLQLQLCPLHGYFYIIQCQSVFSVPVAITAHVEESDRNLICQELSLLFHGIQISGSQALSLYINKMRPDPEFLIHHVCRKFYENTFFFYFHETLSLWCKTDKNIKCDGLRNLLNKQQLLHWLHIGLQDNPNWQGSQEVSRATSFTKWGLFWGQTRLFRVLSSLVFIASKDRGCTPFWGNLFHCLTILTRKMFLPTPSQNLLCSYLCPLPLVFPPCTPGKCLALSSS